MTYQACRGDFVVRLDGSTCLQLWNKEGRVVRREGDPLDVAQWLQACHDAGMEIRVQVNESTVPQGDRSKAAQMTDSPRKIT